MNKAPPWTTKGLDEGADDGARASDRRAGKYPEERPGEKDDKKTSEIGRADGRFDVGDVEDRLHSVAKRLAETADRALRGQPRWRSEREDSDVASAFTGHAAERNRKTTHAVEDVASPVVDDHSVRNNAEEDLSALAKQLRRHDEKSGEERRAVGLQRRSLPDAIAEIVQKRRVLDGRNKPGSDEAIERNGEPRFGAPPAQRFGDLQHAIDSISTQIEAIRSSAVERDNQHRFVMGQINHLRDEVTGLTRALGDLAPRSSIAAIEAALHTLADRIEARGSQGAQDNALAAVEWLAGDLCAIVKEIDPGPIIRGLHADVQTIGHKLDKLKSPGGADPSAIAELTRQTSEIRNLLSAVASRPLPLEKLETRLIDLTRRVEGLGVSARENGEKDLAEIVKSIRSIVATETSGALQALGQRLGDLGAKIDAMQSKSGAKRFDELGHRIDEVHKSLSARIDRNAAFQRPADTSQLEHLLSKIVKKIDASLESKSASDKHFAELAQRLEQTQQTLAVRVEQGAATQEGAYAKIDQLISAPIADKQFERLAGRIDHIYNELVQKIDDGVGSRGGAETAQLAEFVGQLANKIETALDSRADNQALLTLAQQIDKLSRCLDRADKSAGTLTTFERTIGQLFRTIEEKQNVASEVAETAARRAAQEVLREASLGLDGSLERELADIRKTQDESGRRAQETLTAVRDTIERVVDRLAIFEEELTDLRQPSAENREASEAAPISPPAVETPRYREAVKAGRLMSIAELDDFPLGRGAEWEAPRSDFEPGRNDTLASPPGARELGTPSRDYRSENSVKADFIAAARRAAQQAAADAETAEALNKGKIAPRTGSQPSRGENPASAAGRPWPRARKRPFLLALGALVMLIGAYQIVRVGKDIAAPKTTLARNAVEGARQPRAADGRANLAKIGTAPGKSSASAAPGHAAPGRVHAAPSAPAPGPPAAKFVSPQDFAPGAMTPPSSAPPPDAPAPNQQPAARPAAQSTDLDSSPVGAIGQTGDATGGALGAIKELAARGNGAAQFELGARYFEGRGVPRDFEAAARWFETAARQGIVPAEYRVGSIYEKGVGVERDYAKARDWYRRAAQHGNARAMHNLAVMFAQGGDGKPDYLSAASWFRKAAEYGVRDSQYNLGILCARGLGTAQNLTQSYMWFAVAAAQGDDDAAKKRDDIASRLDSKELAEAEALVQSFQPLLPDKAANEVATPPGGWDAVKTPDAAKAPKASGGATVRPKVSAK
jgi:localization factor PodJL